MPESTTSTKWIVSGLVLGGVVVICLILLVASLRDGGSTDTVEPTTTAAPTSSSSVPSSVPDPAPTTSEPDDVVVERVQLRVGNLDRAAIVIEPAEVPAGEAMPAVVALHGLGVDAQAMSRTAAWREAVARDGFVAVFPQGLDNSWNMGPCCPPANLRGIDDRAFLDAVFASLRSRPDVDPQRLFLTGFSNGALMVYSYACERSEELAAIAPMSGSNVTGCEPATPLSLLHQHGDVDLVVPFGGGIALGSLVSSAPFPPVTGSVAAWAQADGCSPEPEVRTDADVERTEWTGCADGTRVELVRVPGKGHEWPRRGAYQPLDEMLAFFGIS